MGIPNSPPTDTNVRVQWVIYELRRRGSSFAAIARKKGCSRRAVAMAMRSPSARLEQAIADELGLSVEVLFPERFNEAGERLHRVLIKSSSSRVPHNVKARAIA